MADSVPPPESERYAELQRRDPAMPDLLLGLLDDPEQDLWLAAIRSYCPPDPWIIERLRGMLDDPRDRAWSEAACALARLHRRWHPRGPVLGRAAARRTVALNGGPP
jgi:hypothetical protein